jgi:hypothetical protein
MWPNTDAVGDGLPITIRIDDLHDSGEIVNATDTFECDEGDAPGFTMSNGSARLSDAPGLGVTIDTEVLSSLATQPTTEIQP